MKEFTKKEDGYCFAFTFNSDNAISNHIDLVNCLYFMKQSNWFVSERDDKNITIWSNDKNNQWVPIQILKDHRRNVNCLIMNNKEDLLISGSDDYQMKFWRKKNDCWKCQQTINTNNHVYALILNEQENKLISCGFHPRILIFEIHQSDQSWILAQTINVSENGLRLCFTIGNQFVFQPKTLDYLEVYNYDNLKKNNLSVGLKM